ncbi:hypothetical protein CAPTEDRAFT_162061 [Capitella teleta]|uniref:BED-type domain-containing protein n=1 Tax=Capitella teleta TaxID=283909 RepID=R7UHD9_CAPTE|nr:hypothetical protein CAPTEDRAFT_162061 [Capitella teleta]|eukprot:ELU03228.1 hypothetical protein CAPTEDRAFT_162061 [Capitella teleta]
MGRKKKKQMKPWCWYCNREFDDEKILIQHQKAKHFKCHICHKKLYTGPGLSIHCMQVHKEKVEKVPNSVPGRHSIEIEIYGMEGIPEEDMKSHEHQKLGRVVSTGSMGMSSTSQGTVAAAAALGILPPMPPSSASGSVPPMPPMPPMPPGMMGMGMPPMPPMGPMGPMGMPGMPPMPMPGMMPGQPPRPGPSSMPPMPSSVAATSSTISAPARPLFPAAAAGSASPGQKMSAPVGPDFRPTVPSGNIGPIRPTFPAYSQPAVTSSSATITGAPTIKKPASASGMSIQLIHPDEDLSLEELRANLPKYKMDARPMVSMPPMINNSAPPQGAGPPQSWMRPPMPYGH